MPNERSTGNKRVFPARRLAGANALFLVLLLGSAAHPQDAPRPGAWPIDLATPGTFAVFDSRGQPAQLGDLVSAASQVDVLFLGERHDDRVAHELQLEIFSRLLDAGTARVQTHTEPLERTVGAHRVATLSLEMFERDIQHVVDEYLSGLITEQHFLRSSRPWPHYREDYRPLVELARERGLRVLAANAPRRYVNLVAREGTGALQSLSPEARRSLPPLPYSPPSDAYRAELETLARGHNHGHGHGATTSGDPLAAETGLMAQALWDAAMAYSIAEELLLNPETQVVHLAGAFHVRNRTGIPEHLARYRPGTTMLIVTFEPVTDLNTFPPELAGSADFVILTDEAHVRRQPARPLPRP
jgi:uncharacterized iron-regulated protein